MIIELNIGLDVANQDAKKSDYLFREKFAKSFLSKHYAIVTDVQESTYEGPRGTATERTLVVAVILSDYLPGAIIELENRVFDLAGALGQDCIAMYAPRHNYGRLVGPKSDKWGDFNPDYFKRLRTGGGGNAA